MNRESPTRPEHRLSSTAQPPPTPTTGQLEPRAPVHPDQPQWVSQGEATPTPATPPSTVPSPSSATAGFFQPPPQIANQYHDDAALTRALRLFAPATVRAAIESDLTAFGATVLSREVMEHVRDAEQQPPHVRHVDTWGRRRDDLVTSAGWRALQRLGIQEGIVAIPFENRFAEYSRVYWCAKYVLWCGSAAWVNCPSLMVDGVAAALRRYLTFGVSGRKGPEGRAEQLKAVLLGAYERLVCRDGEKAWTTGQWMTERQGGSDVSMTETIATWDPDGCSEGVRGLSGEPLGPWRLDGFKWFSSATDADMMVLLARTAKGISLFYAPMRRTLQGGRDEAGREDELNGVFIQRLKNKLGTRALPTAELELKGVRGWLVGEEGRGTKEIATVLNIARVHNGLTAISLWGRGLAIIRAFARVRVVGRRPLWERTGYMRTLSRMHTEYRANVLFNFFVAGLLGCVEQDQVAAFQNGAEQASAGRGRATGQLPGVEDTAMAERLLRVLTPTLKGHCSKTAIAGLQECMECMGGVGYLENDDMQFNIARLYRDANVLPIWEGTTDMMADDSVRRVMMGKDSAPVVAALSSWVKHMSSDRSTLADVFAQEKGIVLSWWSELTRRLSTISREEAELESRAIMTKLVDVVQGLLLLCDASSDGDDIAISTARLWFEGKSTSSRVGHWKQQADADLKIVFGKSEPRDTRARL